MNLPAKIVCVAAVSMSVSGCASMLAVAQFVDSTAVALSGLVPPSRSQPLTESVAESSTQACPTPAAHLRSESPRDYCPVERSAPRTIKLVGGGSLVIRNSTNVGADVGTRVVAQAVEVSR